MTGDTPEDGAWEPYGVSRHNRIPAGYQLQRNARTGRFRWTYGERVQPDDRPTSIRAIDASWDDFTMRVAGRPAVAPIRQGRSGVTHSRD